MSLIARLAPATTRTAAASASATPIYARTAVASFSTTSAQRKGGAVDTAKEKLKKVDKTVSGAAVKGIEKGEHATEKIKDTVGFKAKQAEEKAKKEAAEKGEKYTSDTKGFEG